MPPDFKSLLSSAVDDAKAPEPLPTGTYQFVIIGHAFDQKGQKNTDCVDFTCKAMAAMEDVDEELLAKVENWTEKEQKLTFWITSDALFMLSNFMKDALNISTDGRSFMEAIPETTNAVFLGHIIHETSKKNPDRVFANIDTTAAVEE